MNEPEIRNGESGRRKRWPWIVLPLLLLLFAVNHLEYYSRIRHQRQDVSPGLTVQMESNLTSGHTSIGIDEKSMAGKDTGLLHFSLLGQWKYTPKSPSPCPSAIRLLNGKTVTCIGFMFPLEAGRKIKTFCLMRTTQTCCYGPRPQYNQYLLTEMKKPVKFERLSPVIVKGRFVVDPQPAQGFIYRLEGESIVPVAEEGPEENPAEISAKTKLPLFDFTSLSMVETSSGHRLPPGLLSWDQREVIVAGYFSGREETNFLICRNYWNGADTTLVPTFYNSVMVYPETRQQIPPVWKEKGVMKGVLKVEKNHELWGRNGIVSLHHAINMGNGGAVIRTDIGPFLGHWEELLLLAAVLYFAFRKEKKKQNRAGT